MHVVTKKLNEVLNSKGWSKSKFARLINYHRGSLYKMIQGKSAFPDDLIIKMCSFLEISEDDFNSWIMADKYSRETLETAIQEIEKREDKTLILTKNIDKILQNKAISRTTLSKMIVYSQSGLNRMIIGQQSMSKSVIERISPILEIPEDTITGWVIADKYPLELLKLALNSKNNE